MSRIEALAISKDLSSTKTTSTRTGQTSRIDFYSRHLGWHAVHVIALSRFVASIVLSTITIGPELAVNLSTVPREDKHAEFPEGMRTLADDERGQLLRHVKVKIDNKAPAWGCCLLHLPQGTV